MKRHKLTALFLLVFLICIVVIFAVTIFSKTSPSELLLRFEMVSLILKKELSKPPMPPPSEIFRQHILDPIPESVANIRADQPKNLLGSYRYTLRFNIDRADLALLIDSLSLVRVWNVEYRDGDLFWALDTWRGLSMNGVTIIVYDSRRRRREPKWFRPELWDNPEAYAFREKIGDRMYTQVLLYNEKEGEAYFIVSNLK
ncbi:MAG: hypothetical protein ACYTBX_03980 [Planctomycetota bacterium]